MPRVVIIMQDKAKHDASLPTYSGMPGLIFFGNFDHFCPHYQALYVPKFLIEEIKKGKIVSGGGRVDLVVVKPPFSNMFTLPLALQLH